MTEQIKVTCSIEKVRFYKNQFGIILCSIDKVTLGTPKLDRDGYLVCKGVMPQPIEGNMYNITAEYVEDKKWGDQYNIQKIYSAVVFKEDDIIGQKKFLTSIFTPLQVTNMYDALSDPFTALKDKDMSQLVQIKGCGMNTAIRWVDRFQQNYYIGKIFTELESCNLTNSMVKRLMNRYGSPDLVIDKVKNNPYVLCNEVKGIGWKTADKIALDGGMSLYDSRRISAYIIFYLDSCGENGCSWITPDELLGAILEELGDDTPDANISQAIQELNEILWWDDDKTKIGLRRYFNIENRIAEELIRIRDAKSDIKYDDWEDTIKHLEHRQGWEFTDEQKQGIEVGLKNNVVVITGSGGTGKSSLVAGILEVLKQYSFAQCALSGRASSRLSEVTGEEGYTIHRLLGFPSGQPNKGKFEYHDEYPLSQDIIIVDEISMIDGFLFYNLLRAIKDGAKVFLLGDPGQLESIGSCNIAFDMIQSPEIPTVMLTKIHRQAAKSAIITESIKVRNGQQLIAKEWTGIETRGELQDLTLDCYSDASNTFYEIMKTFSADMGRDDFRIMDTQIIVPIKMKGSACTYELNSSIQELYNPSDKKKREITAYTQGKPYILRTGDKVINTANNYKTEPAIFNGNIGVIKSFGVNDLGEEIMTIDFMGLGEVDVTDEFWSSIELAYATTCHKCITGDTYIYTNNGLKQIVELDTDTKTGDYLKLDNVQVYNGIKMEKTSHFYNAGVSECKKITTSRGYELTATLDHGVNIIDSIGNITRRNVKDLKIGDNVIIIKGQKIFGEQLDLPVTWRQFNTDIRTVIYNLPNIMTTDFAKFLGYMVGDGCVAKNKIQFGKNQLEVAEDFAKLVFNIFNFTVKSIRHLNGELGGMRLIEVHSKFITDYCKNISGIQPHNKFVPECILNAPMEYQCAFLSGVFEDGSVNIKNGKFDHIEFCTSELKLCNQIRMMLLNLGIGSTYRVIRKNAYIHHILYIYKRDAQEFIKYIKFTSFEKQNRLMLCNRIEKHSNERKIIPYVHSIIMSLQDKYNLRVYEANHNLRYSKGNNGITYSMLKVFLKYYKDTEVAKDEHFKKLQFIHDNCIIDPIRNLENTTEQTYCLTMPETHQFVQNGIWGWNCQGSEFYHVIFGIDFSAYSLLSREMIYTGITRARKKCTLIAQTGALRMAISKEGVSKKQTHLQYCLYEVSHPKLVF